MARQCRVCGVHETVEGEFKNTVKRGNICRKCRRAADNGYRAANGDQFRNTSRRWYAVHGQKHRDAGKQRSTLLRREIIDQYGPDCKCCGETELASLTLDHIEGGTSGIGTFKIRPRTGEYLSTGDAGGASRFFYTAKADKVDRDGSKHPTIKPLDLMKWLVRLVAPPGALILDPFMGSGSTVAAARALGGYRIIGIDQDPASVEDAIRRLRQEVLAL